MAGAPSLVDSFGDAQKGQEFDPICSTMERTAGDDDKTVKYSPFSDWISKRFVLFFRIAIVEVNRANL